MKIPVAGVGLSAIALTLAGAALGADASMVDLVTPDAQIVTGIDVDRVKNSPFGQYLLGQMKGQEDGLSKLMSATGFDPRRDLHEVLIVSRSAAPAAARGGGMAGSLVLVRASVDPSRIAQLAGQFGGAVTSYNGSQLIAGSRGGAAGADSAWVGFLGNFLVMGPEADVKSAVDRHRSSAKAAAGMASRIQSASGKYDAWLVTTASPAALAGNLSNQTMAGAMQGDLVKGIESIAAGARFGANVEFGGEATTRSAQDAAALVDVAKFFVQMAQSNGAKSGMFQMLDTLKVDSEGRTVRFNFTAPEQDFERLLAPRVERGRQRARGVALD